MHVTVINVTFLQMVMAVFAYIYHQSFVTPQSVSVEMILDQVKLTRNIASIYISICILTF